ncbi:MAG: amidase [Pseudomonadota bacterium]
MQPGRSPAPPAADPTLWSAAQLGAAYRAGRLSIPAAIAAHQRRIDRMNDRYHVFSHLDRAGAATAAERLADELARGRDRGPLHGIAVSIKGSLAVAGLPFTEGSAVFADRVAARDDPIPARLRDAGGVILGVTTLSELAMYGVDNPFEPLALNPWAPDRTGGGSSCGAGVAALLAMATINIGTDAGGSARNPACHNGVIGFMASPGVLPIATTSQLATAGIIARRMSDIGTAFDAFAPAPAAPPPGRTLVVPRRLIAERCCEATLALFETACAKLGAAGYRLAEAEIDSWIEAERTAGTVLLAEAGRRLAGLDLSRAGESIRRRFAAAGALSAGAEADGLAAMARFAEAVRRSLAEHRAAAFLTPTWPFAAPPIHAETARVRDREVPVDPHRNCFVRAANALTGCAVTLPAGFYEAEGVPMGVQLMAPRGVDRALLDLAAGLAPALPPLGRAPPPLAAAEAT